MEQFLIDTPHAEKIVMLETFDIVDDLSPSQINQLAHFFTLYAPPADTLVLEEGEVNQFFCLIYDGSVKVLKSNAAYEPKQIQTIGAGRIFGEMSFFDNGPCSASIVVQNDAVLLRMDKTNFNSLCMEVPTIALKTTLNLLSNISKRLRQTTGKLIDFL